MNIGDNKDLAIDDGIIYVISQKANNPIVIKKISETGVVLESNKLVNMGNFSPNTLNIFNDNLIMTGIQHNTNSPTIIEFSYDNELVVERTFESYYTNHFNHAFIFNDILIVLGSVKGEIPEVNNEFFGGVNGFVWREMRTPT